MRIEFVTGYGMGERVLHARDMSAIPRENDRIILNEHLWHAWGVTWYPENATVKVTLEKDRREF